MSCSAADLRISVSTPPARKIPSIFRASFGTKLWMFCVNPGRASAVSITSLSGSPAASTG